nr:hypothetical protein [Mesorhizobium sp.]
MPRQRHRRQIAEAEQPALNVAWQLHLHPELRKARFVEFGDDPDANRLQRQLLPTRDRQIEFKSPRQRMVLVQESVERKGYLARITGNAVWSQRDEIPIYGPAPGAATAGPAVLSGNRRK